jgi:hypothetical protein
MWCYGTVRSGRAAAECTEKLKKAVASMYAGSMNIWLINRVFSSRAWWLSDQHVYSGPGIAHLGVAVVGYAGLLFIQPLA